MTRSSALKSSKRATSGSSASSVNWQEQEKEALKALEELEQLKRSMVAQNPIAAYRPHAKQQEFHNSPAQERWFLGGNRSGKTMAGAAEAAWAALGLHGRKAPSLGWIVSVSYSQQQEAAEKALIELIPAAEILRPIHGAKGGLALLDLRNGSRIIFHSCEQGSSALQGAGLDWVWFDEEPDEPIWKETVARVGKNALRVWVTLTPLKGFSWTYQRLFRDRPLNSEVFRVATSDNPHLPAGELARLEREYTGPMARARLYGEYVDLVGQGVIPWELLARLRQLQVEPRHVGNHLGGVLQVWEENDESACYVVGADPASGDPDPGRDFQAIEVLRRHPLREVACWRGKVPPDEFGRVAAGLAERYGMATLGIERNGLGIASLIAAGDYPNLYSDERHARVVTPDWSGAARLGWVTSTETRPLMLSGIIQTLRDGMEVYCADTVEELASLIYGPTGKVEARGGWHDDRAFALMIAVQMHLRTPYEPRKAKPATPTFGTDAEWREWQTSQRAARHLQKAFRRANSRSNGEEQGTWSDGDES